MKYRSPGKKKRGRKASSKPSATKNGAAKPEATDIEKVNKSAEIRNAYKALGKKARPKDVVAALAEKGITVAPAQVSMVRIKMKAKKAAEATGTSQRRGSTTKSTGGISGQDLLEAKRLADQLGGVERLKAALDILAMLA